MAMRTGGRGSRPGPYDRPEPEEADATKVFVGNLSFDTTWKELKDHMKAAGSVMHADVMTGEDGRSRGFGIVRFSTEEEAAEAIESLTETELDGRTILVRADKGGGGKGKGKGEGGRGKGKGKGGRPSASSLDDDLDSYFSGKDAPEAIKKGRVEAKATNLDDDLDAYFAGGKKSEAAEE
mmetsp:Transcript_40063/g.105360  ORF Transcript_40063/g.105360 Transcript_40063/m.105360 type:complete len:180 (-) Transcript_40063:654-1193(-)